MASKKSLNKAAIQKRSNDAKDYNSFKVVLFYCLLIIFFPVITFFIVKNLICDNFLTMTQVTANISSAMCAVVALHVALGLYIYRAYFNDDSSSDTSMETEKKQD